jgi:alpha-L-fucosidase
LRSRGPARFLVVPCAWRCPLLLLVPPRRAGLLAESDVDRLRAGGEIAGVAVEVG